MLRYVDEAKSLYNSKKIDAEGFISRIWEGIKKNANDENVVERATKAFLRLRLKGDRSPVRGKDIITEAGFKSYNNYNSHGLWPWLKKKGNAGVIEQGKNDSGEIVYSVNDDFCRILRKIVMGPPSYFFPVE